MDTKELKALNLLHHSPGDEHGGLCGDRVAGAVVILPPHGQVSDLLPIGCLLVVGDQANHYCVVRQT